jgi:hypothetical protein
MNNRSTSWKVAILGPTGAALTGSAFELLYAFPSKEEAEEHAECFRHTGVKLALCDAEGTSSTCQLSW